MNIIIDNEFKALIPSLTTEEFSQLETNIISEGCRDSLVVWNDILIDGHNRHAICTKHDIQFKTSEKAFESREKVKEWIILNQFGRRNLTTGQRANLTAPLREIWETRARESQGTRTDLFVNSQISCNNPIDKVNTTKELSKVSGLGEQTISRYNQIKQKAPEEIKQKVLSGEISINQAYQEVRREEKQQEREIKIQKREIETIDFKCENFVNGDSIEELNKFVRKYGYIFFWRFRPRC